jgi:chromosomal replication initiation ATPase DnaA
MKEAGMSRKRFTAEKVIGVLGVEKAMITGRGRKGSEARGMATYLVKRYSGMGNGKIGAIFGGIHPSAVTKARGRVEEKMKKDARIRGLMGTIMSKAKA